MLSKRIINFGWQFSFFASFLLKEILLKAQVVHNLPEILILQTQVSSPIQGHSQFGESLRLISSVNKYPWPWARETHV